MKGKRAIACQEKLTVYPLKLVSESRRRCGFTHDRIVTLLLQKLLDLPVHRGCTELHAAHDLDDLVYERNHHFGFAAIDCHVKHAGGSTSLSPRW